MSIRWCGMPRRSTGATLSVPMSNPRYTAVESQLMISPPKRSATASPTALFPVAVGPRIAISRPRMSADAENHVEEKRDGENQESKSLRLRHLLIRLGPHPQRSEEHTSELQSPCN